MRRVVVTGLGMLTPLGCGVEPTWTRLLKGESGAKKIDHFDVSDIACKIGCVVPRGDGSNATYNPEQWMEPIAQVLTERRRPPWERRKRSIDGLPALPR